VGNMHSFVYVYTGYFGRVLIAYGSGHGRCELNRYGGDGVGGITIDVGCVGAGLWVGQSIKNLRSFHVIHVICKSLENLETRDFMRIPVVAPAVPPISRPNVKITGHII
jgi:hypothetical protein